MDSTLRVVGFFSVGGGENQKKRVVFFFSKKLGSYDARAIAEGSKGKIFFAWPCNVRGAGGRGGPGADG